MIQIVVQRVIIMLIIVLVGFVCGKTGILTTVQNRGISGILINVALPAMCINCFQKDLTRESVGGLLITAGLMAVFYTITILISKAVFKKGKAYEPGISAYAAIYGNAGFMGVPIVEALLGSTGVLYLTLHIALVNSFGYIQGENLIGGKSGFSFKKICNMPIIGITIGLILFILRVRLPEPLLIPVKTLGNMVTPLAMLMTGVSFSTFRIKELAHIKEMLKVNILRLFIFPLPMIFMCAFLPIDPVIKMTNIIAASCPSLAFTLVIAIKHQKNDLYASELISMSTLLFVISLPLMVALSSLLGISVPTV